jgi:hypothetical protein
MSAIRPKTMAPTAEAPLGHRVQQRDLAGGQAPLGLDQHDHDADHEQVVGISEEAHARDEHDLPLEPGDLGVVQGVEHPRW